MKMGLCCFLVRSWVKWVGLSSVETLWKSLVAVLVIDMAILLGGWGFLLMVNLKSPVNALLVVMKVFFFLSLSFSLSYIQFSLTYLECIIADFFTHGDSCDEIWNIVLRCLLSSVLIFMHALVGLCPCICLFMDLNNEVWR